MIRTIRIEGAGGRYLWLAFAPGGPAAKGKTEGEALRKLRDRARAVAERVDTMTKPAPRLSGREGWIE